ncbi:MAG: hypothetical protein HZA79_15385 [Sphingobacteriales bacterium]|nr:hypothetical protein [Sphingobacteriales bacterium]
MSSTLTPAISPEKTHPENIHPWPLRLAARFISYIFHPVFLPLYVMAFLVFEHPYLFTGFGPREKVLVLLQAVAMYLFFPLVTVLLLKALGFIESVQLKKQKDRIIPLIACMIWYFWIWNVWRNLPEYPGEAVRFALAIWISSWAALMANVKIKISLHAISVGIAATFILLMAFTQALNFGIYIAVSLFITGLVCTARFLVSDHTQAEIYGGLALGAVSMIVASFFA